MGRGMKNWRTHCPAFMKRLWCQLAISYTLLAFCALTVLILLLYGMDDYKDFHATLNLDSVEEQVASERLTLAQGIRDGGNTEWLEKARDNIRKKLMNLEHGSGTSIYRITSSSRPEVYVQILDKNGVLLLSDPAMLPERAATQFTAQAASSAAGSNIRKLGDNGPIWVDMPIPDDGNESIGRVRVLYVAEFSLWVQLQSLLAFLRFVWAPMFICSVPIGIACGFVASRYVTRQLRKMNAVTESWRQGNFEARIALPDDDVLIRHSQHLNDMAQDLEMFLRLKQGLAVSDERNRVARELHDTVKQKLFALGLQLATAKTKPAVMEAAREHILEAEAITREAQHDLTEIITQLRPAGTGDLPFYDRMTTLADDFRRRFGVRIDFDRTAPIQPAAQTEHHVLRIVQEALMNAVRHGKASHIVITGSIEQDAATLTIADNGTGFDTSKQTDGFGITSMRGRMRDVPRGTFALESTAGEGTRIRLAWKNDT